jgi:hypothetical protein
MWFSHALIKTDLGLLMDSRNFVVMASAVAFLVGCGGGGSSSSSTTTAPTVTFSLSQFKVALGSPATLTWSSTDSTTCTASGAWSGAHAASGTSVQTPTSSGSAIYTLTCTGAGGVASKSLALVVPIPVLKSSYENKAAAGEVLGTQALPAEVGQGNAVAFADFFQDGTYSMVTHSLEYNPQDSSTSNKFGHIHFWQKVNGVWTDNTSKLLADNTGCLHPRKAIVADFNGSGRPSIFFACHGFDASPFPGEQPHLLLSQADGTYKNVKIPITGFFHSAAAADVNGNGFPDILVADNIVQGQPYFLINNKDGTFTKDLTRLPASTQYKPIFTAELIRFSPTGKYDVFLGGHEQQQSDNWPATILPNDGSGAFVTTTPTVLPALSGYGFPTDLMFVGGNIYLSRTVDLQSNFYGGAAIQKITYPALLSQSLFQSTSPFSSGTKWINWIISHSGNIVTMDSLYGVSVAQ